MLAYGLVLAAVVPLLGIGLLSYERANVQARALEHAQLIVQAVDKQLRDRLFLLGRQLDTAVAGAVAAPAGAFVAADDPAHWPIPILDLRLEPDRMAAEADGRRLLAIGVPAWQGGRWVVPVSRRTLDGRRVHGQVDASLFAEVLQGYSLGVHDRLNVLHADGMLLARSHDNDWHVGARPEQAASFNAQWRTSAGGTFTGRSDLDGVQRQFLFKRLPDLPLIVLVGTEQRSVLAAWAGFAGTVFLLSLLLGLSWAWLTRRFAQGKRRQSHLIGELKQTIETLNRTEERLRQAHSLAALGEWELDLGTGMVHWDEQNWRTYGQPSSDKPATLDAALAVVDPRDRPALQDMVRKLMDGSGPPLDTQYRMLRADGSVRWIHSRAELVVAASGRRHLHGVQQDITDLVLTRERLDAAERQYRLMFDINPLPMWVYDLESLQLLAVNETAIGKYGYSREEFLALTVLDIRPADERAEAAALLKVTPMVDHSGRAWRHLLKDGSVIHVNNVGVDIDFNGRRACLVLIRDISNQLNAEAAQRRSEERFRLIARATSDAVYDLDIDSDTLWWSDSFYATFGFLREQVPATLEAWEAMVHPDDLARVGASLQAAIDADASEWEEEYRFSCHGGGFAQVIDRGYLLRDADGRATRMVGGMLDVTEKRRADADLLLLRRAIEVTRNGIIISDARQPDHPVVYVNPAFERITGYSAAEILGRNCRLLQLDDHDQVGIQGLRLALREERETRVLLRNYRRDGTLFYNEFQLAPVRDAG
ncbi:MAG: PAS domain S-box protein, partial [Pseudoxanthomonas sp.]